MTLADFSPRELPRRAQGQRPARRAAWHHVVAAVGAFFAVSSYSAGTEPLPVFDAFDGNSIVSIAAFGAMWACGLWVLRAVRSTAPRVFAWAVPFAALFALAELAGRSLLGDGADLSLLRPSAWGVVHLLGVAYATTMIVAAVLITLDRTPPVRQNGQTPQRGWLPRLLAVLGEGTGRTRWGAIAAVYGAIVLLRLPYLVVWWPGLIFFDSYRSLSYARGLGPWEAYEPLGHSFLIAGWNFLWESLGWSDGTAIAFAAVLQLLSSTAVFVFLLVRLAVWGADHRVWGAAFLWLAMLPILSLSSITIVKDIPFMSAFVVFAIAVAEIGRADSVRRPPRWAWPALALSAIAVVMLRSNGVYVVLLSLPLLFLAFRRYWKQMAAVVVAVGAAVALYVGPVSAGVGALPGPKTEMWSVPLQQIARIAVDHHAELDPQDRDFVDSIFTLWDADELEGHYIPEFADPIKLDARDNWDSRTLGEFLTGWARLVSEYPMSAVTATLANTVGYWAPGAPSYDGLIAQSHNDVRGISLDIPDRDDERVGIQRYLHANHLVGYLNRPPQAQNVPVLGQAMSPGTVTWIWLLAGLVLVRRRAWHSLPTFLPAAVLMMTFLAGPVSGGTRYMLVFYAALPLVIGLASLRPRPEDSAPASS